MAKTIGDRISDSFVGDNSVPEAKDYADKVYAAWKDVSASLSRNAVLIFVLIAVFELLAYQKESTVFTVGSFTFTNTPIILVALPAIVAIIMLDGWRLTTRWVDLQYAFQELVKRCAPKLSENDLDILIRPALPAYWSIGIAGSERSGQPSEKFIRSVSGILAVTMTIVTPLAFEAQAYYRLFGKFGYQNILLWFSVSITTILMTCAFVYAWKWGQEPGR